MKRKFIQILKSKDGFGYVEFAIILIAFMLCLSFLLKLMPVYTAKQQLDIMASKVAREIEVYGEIGTQANDKLNTLISSTHINAAVAYSKTGRVQLNEEFTVTLTYTYDLGLFGGFGSYPVGLRSKAVGRGEVYWKS